ncbi:BlaI/MecI/CopY family transcriptional regulator [Bacteroidota bacterium]
MEKLTKAEEEVMLIIWDLEHCTVRDVLDRLKDQDIAYTTVASIIRLLENKNYVSHRAIGNTYLFHPAIDKESYMNSSLKGFLNKYFEGSFTNLASFFATENNISMRELRDMMAEVREDLNEDRKKENR